MKVYISGKITGLQIEEVNEKFNKAASYIRSIWKKSGLLLKIIIG